MYKLPSNYTKMIHTKCNKVRRYSKINIINFTSSINLYDFLKCFQCEVFYIEMKSFENEFSIIYEINKYQNLLRL